MEFLYAKVYAVNSPEAAPPVRLPPSVEAIDSLPEFVAGQRGALLDEMADACGGHLAGRKLIDIGCGWGGMSLYMAEHFDVEVTGVTLSVEQHRLAQERAEKLGLSHRVRFELRDYRDVTGTFDRIVSIGMFEHVGRARLDDYFARLASIRFEAG